MMLVATSASITSARMTTRTMRPGDRSSPATALLGDQLDAPVRLRAARARHEGIALGHLVLEPTDVGVLRRQLDRPARGLHQPDRLGGLAQRGLLRIGRQVEQADASMFSIWSVVFDLST